MLRLVARALVVSNGAMVLAVLSTVLVGLAISATLCAVVLNFSKRLGLVDAGGREAHKRHATAVPNLGGVGVFWAVVGPLAIAVGAAVLMPQTLASIGLDAELVEGLASRWAEGLVLLVGLAAMHAMGLIDDRKPLGPYSKLAVQLGVALLLVLGAKMRVLELLDGWGTLGFIMSVALSVLWIIIIVNAMNFLDNMDGLAGGVGAIIAAIYLAATLIAGQWFVAAMAALLLGALLGFLIFNVHPAKLFMGDGGSLVLGLCLAVISIRTTYFAEASAALAIEPGHAWHGVLMPLVVMAVPLYDFASVTVIRLAKGRSPLSGDHNHFSHRLLRRGLGVRGAVGVVWLCTAATGLSGVMLGSLEPWQAWLAGLQTLAVLAVLAVLELDAKVE